MHARIDLEQTNYSMTDMAGVGIKAQLIRAFSTDELDSIYVEYCQYKKFPSVMPLFSEEYLYPQADVIAYYDTDVMVAFTLMFRYNTRNVAANQFAWTYHNPKLRLGIRSLHYTCAYYKSEGFKYLYLGDAAAYKKHLDGFELCGPV